LAEPRRGMTNGDHFGMGGRVEIAAHGIASFRDYFVAFRDHCADRNLSSL
jgi:hypothetical protein